MTGEWPDERFVITAEGERALAETREQIRAEARELAERRHAAAQEGSVIYLPGTGNGA